MSVDTISFSIDEAIIKLPRKTVIRNFLASLETESSQPLTTKSIAPKIGEYWPNQGGVNAGLMRGTDGNPDYYLIVAIDPMAYFENIIWGAGGKDEPDAASDSDGLANTTALVNSKHEHPAAEKIAAITIDGHSDFYLPARRELSLLYANVPEQFENNWYWSSTQYSADCAWGQSFGLGYQSYDGKDYRARARAVRRLLSY